MRLVSVTNGFGQLLPYRAAGLGPQANPLGTVVELRTIEDYLLHVRDGNPVLPVAAFAQQPELPTGAPGNHFISARFTREVRVNSVLDSTEAGVTEDALTGAVAVVAIDPLTGHRTAIAGRLFVDGQVYGGTAVGGSYSLQRWVVATPGGALRANPNVDNNGDGRADGVGFPGTEVGFPGDVQLLGPNTLTFVVDSDDDLATHETFPAGRVIRFEMNGRLLAVGGRRLVSRAVASTTVGPDSLAPEALQTAPSNGRLVMQPADGSVDVDPLAPITVEFTEAIQPWSLAALPSNAVPLLSPALQVAFGSAGTRVAVPFSSLPVSPFDLTRFELQLAFDLPGDGPVVAGCAALNQIAVEVAPFQLADLSSNVNTLGAQSSYATGEGPGLVNAPVTPDAVYVGRSGASPALSVIDLNGFGGGTGNPAFDPSFQVFQEGETLYPLNPNVLFQGSSLYPPLAPGSCTVNGGSAGVFTLTKDSSLDNRVVRDPLVQSMGDMALGHPLDMTYNNGPAPYGCQSGGGKLCAQDGFKQISMILGGPTTIMPQPLIPITPPLQSTVSAGNIASWAPSPNPPPLVFPPLCVSPFIGGQEPTSVQSFYNAATTNLLAPGDAFGDPAAGVPPSGMLSTAQNSFWFGPSPSNSPLPACAQFMIRQQVGQFLYVIDRAAREVVVFNSNRMTIIDRLELSDPTEFAMGTNLDLLAVTNQATDSVSFIDVDPSSATFHQVVQETPVGDAPRGIAWDGANEDVLVCNEGSDSVSIIATFTLQVRKQVTAHLSEPFAIATTSRQIGFSFQRNVYFGYIVNRDGTVAVFESGPSGINGWGYDDVIGPLPYSFQEPRAIQADPRGLNSSVWVAHEGPIDLLTGQAGALGTPALTKVDLDSATVGMIALTPQNSGTPQFRNMSYVASVSLGAGTLSGIPVDIAFDNLRNYAGLQNGYPNPFSAGAPVVVNGKSLARSIAGSVRPSNAPDYLFVAVPDSGPGTTGSIQVIDASAYGLVDTNPYQAGVQAIDAPDVTSLMDYFRQ